MVEFAILDSREIKLDNNGFILVETKRAKSGIEERDFVQITKGTDRDGNRKFKQTLTIPRSAEVVAELEKALESVV